MQFFKSLDFEKIAAFLLSLALFLLTLWRFGANQCFALVAIMVVFYRPWRQNLLSWNWIKTPVIFWALVLIIWALMTLSYTETPSLVKGVQGIGTYSKLLYLLIFPIALQFINYRKWLENGLIYGVLINVMISTLYYFHVPGISPYFAPHMSMDITFTVNPLQVIYIVVMAMWLLTMRFVRRNYHWHDVMAFILLLLYLWVINMERSGYLIFLALVLFLLWQRFGKKAFISGCIALPIVLIGLYFVLPNVKARVNLGVENVIAFQQAESSQQMGINNSLGVRLSFIVETLQVMRDHPILGTGIGSFKYVHQERFAEQEKTVQINDPHNAYAYVGFELGLIGLLIYLAWLYAVFKLTRTLPVFDAMLLRGVWLIFIVMGFTDSGLALNAIGMSFIAWISLYSRKSLTSC